MRSIKLFSLSLAAIAVFFSSCKKEDNLAEITYQVKTTNRSAGLVNWTSGTGSGKQIEFKGNRDGSRVEEYILSLDPVDFFASNGAIINTVQVGPGTYSDIELNYELIPSRNPALQLKGTYNASGTSVPVTLNLENYLEIGTRAPSITLSEGQRRTAVINLDLSAVTQGITSTMLNNATRTNGEILISYYSNLPLYTIIINNINNKTHTVDILE